MITINNRKDTYDNTTRGETTGPRCRNKGRVLGASLQRSRCEEHPATGEKPKAAAHGSEARRKDQRPGNPGGRAPRNYTGIQARAKERSLSANQLRRRLMDRGLRAPSSMSTKLQAASYKRQATSSKRSWIASHESRPGIQASSNKLQAASSGICVPS